MGAVRNWTKEECQYLEENWGMISIPTIAKNLNRSVNAIKLKAQRLELGRHIHSGDYITYNQFRKALNINGGYYLEKLIRLNFPFKRKKSLNRAYRVVYLEDFWKWADKNKHALDFGNMTPGILGAEPDWVDIKRQSDKNRSNQIKKVPWTHAEDKQLEWLINQYKYGYKDIARLIQRSEGAIKRRLCDLNIKGRPIKADNQRKWELWEIELLIEMFGKGYTYEDISKKLNNRSVCAIKGKLARITK